MAASLNGSGFAVVRQKVYTLHKGNTLAHFNVPEHSIDAVKVILSITMESGSGLCGRSK